MEGEQYKSYTDKNMWMPQMTFLVPRSYFMKCCLGGAMGMLSVLVLFIDELVAMLLAFCCMLCIWLFGIFKSRKDPYFFDIWYCKKMKLEESGRQQLKSRKVSNGSIYFG